MQIPCIIDQTKTLKKGMKITLAIEDDQVPDVLKHIHKFHDRDLLVNLQIDAAKEEEKLSQISNKQRKKIYVLFRDIASATGHNKEQIKEEMKRQFIKNTDYAGEKISLANCSKEEASALIEYIINFCFEHGIPIQDKPQDYFDDIEKAMYVCLKNKICCVCGQVGEVDHWECIGAGRNRTKIDDSNLKKIALCREHHTEKHKIGVESFAEKYHVKGIIYNE